MINTFVALDIETTGLNPAEDKIIEIGMAKISDGEIVDSYSTLVNPGIILITHNREQQCCILCWIVFIKTVH